MPNRPVTIRAVRDTGGVKVFENDRMGMTISHEMRIDGDVTWIKYEYTTGVQRDETAEQLNTRIIKVIQDAMKVGIAETIKFVRDQGE